MRIQPLLNRQMHNNVINSKKTQTQFVRRNITTMPQVIRYTGNAGSDLAYASMFDSAIAYDLKMMGLIQ